MSERKKISVVVSVYNEELSVEEFYKATHSVAENLLWDYEIIFVNDGSTDKSQMLLEGIAKENEKVKVVSFARNFGHEAAMIAGIDYATGDAIVCMDADLQHPPEYIPEIIERFEAGYHVVSMVRTKNKDASFFKRSASTLFYKILNRFSDVKFEENSSDFFGISSAVAQVLKKDYREKVRYLRGYVQSVGFEKTTIEFEANKRFAGESKYSIKSLVRFSVNALCCFSRAPLKLALYSGIFMAVRGFALAVVAVVMAVQGIKSFGFTGWLHAVMLIIGVGSVEYTGMIAGICLMFAIVLFVLGIFGEYIMLTLIQVRDRPIYIVKDVINSEESLSERNEK